jgi:TolB-like protein
VAIERLSPRRREVLELLARGLTNEEIAGVLAISRFTARAHVTAVLSELGVANRTEATALYLAAQAQVSRISEILARPAIMVLPLQPLGDEPRERTLARGFTHDIQALLSRWTFFPVIADVSVVGARAWGATSEEIGQRTGARFVVDGALRSQGSAWRLSVRIDDTTQRRCIWVENYDFADSALFETMDAVSEAVASSSYAVLLAHVARAPPRSQRLEDLSAWELAHVGLGLQGQRERAANSRAQEYFRQALAREPTLVLAHFGLGLCQYDQALNQWGDPAPVDRLRDCAQQCLELAPHAAEGHFLLARASQAQGEPTRGIGPCEDAIGRNPSFAAAHALLAQLLIVAGRVEEGRQRMNHASRLAPGAYVAGLAVAHFLCDANAEALAAAESALATNPGYTFARVMAISSAWWLGDRRRAELHAGELKRRHPDFQPRVLLQTFGVEQVERMYQALEGIGLGR